MTEPTNDCTYCGDTKHCCLDDSCARQTNDIARLKARVVALDAELETERMRVAACGVVAMANTPETATKARRMHQDYWCASVADVARIVDAEMAGRVRIGKLESALRMLLTIAEEVQVNTMTNVHVRRCCGVKWNGDHRPDCGAQQLRALLEEHL